MQYLIYFLVATPLVAPAVTPNRVARNTAAPRNE